MVKKYFLSEVNYFPVKLLLPIFTLVYYVLVHYIKYVQFICVLLYLLSARAIARMDKDQEKASA